MMSSDDLRVPVLLRCGFVCRRQCWSVSVTAESLAEPLPAPPESYLSCTIGTPEYDRCLRLCYEYYQETHRDVNSLTATLEDFAKMLGKCICIYDERDGEVIHCAFIDDDKIAYLSTRDMDSLRPFAQMLAAIALERSWVIFFKCDDCDPAAMTLFSLFAVGGDIPFCTYILEQ